MDFLTPKEIVSELDKNIIGQQDAKKAVAIALRNRWRRKNVEQPLQDEILPKNILMIGPTGVGKTEIARRLAKLSQAPFVKVEATKFTEVGYVGRDVEQIIRDLLSISITQEREKNRQEVEKKAEKFVTKRILAALVGDKASDSTKNKFLMKLEKGELDNTEIEIDIMENKNSSMSTIDVPGMPGAQMGMLNINDLLGKNFGSTYKKKHLKVIDAIKIITSEEVEKLIDSEYVINQAIKNVEQNGIVFIDEIDKICGKGARQGGEVSREGVQRDLLPLIEGTSVSTKHGTVKTDHILFVTSGAFHVAKPSDLLPELQGRLPIRVELKSLTQEDFSKILTEPESSLVKQYQALIKTEGISLIFTEDSIQEIARLSVEINNNIEDIGARRLHAVLEKLLEDISFTASDLKQTEVIITIEEVKNRIGKLTKKEDISKFIL